ncbi:hypothetical protein CPT_Palo_015 [Rhizobium phage Palo]|uniref:Uncharacterized protein n=1 Tax=Rhizobium phage Palo TaxID=2767573 RepID=A0A7L8G4I6_9CAUD|nr:hypothetical protein CPT_Palo_015 [Rhizobium phage Palo]
MLKEVEVSSSAAEKLKTVERLLRELLEAEVVPALRKFSQSALPIMWSNSDPVIAYVRGKRWLTDSEVTDMWEFADKSAIQSPQQFAERAVATLGVTKNMFWCIVWHYALYQGLRDYKAVHGGYEPEDMTAYLYAMLTCDNPGEEIRKDF